MPTCACESEKISVIRDVSEYLECRVMLEEEVQLDAYPANIFEHVAELHVIRVRAETIETNLVSTCLRLGTSYSHIVVINGAHMRDLCESLPQEWLVEVTRVVVEIRMRNILLMSCCPSSVLSVVFARL